MTARLLLRYKPRRVETAGTKGKARRRFEYFLLFLGLIAIDYYIWVSVDATYYQAYESWSFDRQLHQQPASLLRFIEERLGLTVAPVEDSTAQPKAGQRAEGARAPRPAPLAVIGRIDVPRLRLTAMVREGTDEDTLMRAVGHIPSTSLPGETGNVGLAGHRDTFFRKLQAIKKDDRIVVSTLHGDYEYQVESLKIVLPKDVGVLKPQPGQQSLTLVTCYPFYYVGSAPKRFIVRARQVEVNPPLRQTGS